MKHLLYCALLLTGLTFFASCSSGDYNVSPDGNSGSTSVNPLHALTSSQFTWSGTGELSALINGSPWVSTTTTFVSSGGQMVIVGMMDTTYFTIYMTDGIGVGSVTGMGYNQFGASGYYYASISDPYYSNLGNSGEMLVTQNSSTNVSGKFYFTGKDLAGNSISVSDGYFNVPKP